MFIKVTIYNRDLGLILAAKAIKMREISLANFPVSCGEE